MHSVSIIVPVYHKQNTIGRFIESLAAQDYPSSLVDIQFVFSDQGDPCLDTCKAADLPFSRTIAFSENSGASHQRNHGINLARGEYCVFFDPDLIMPANTLRSMVNRAMARKNRVVMAPVMGGSLSPEIMPYFIQDYENLPSREVLAHAERIPALSDLRQKAAKRDGGLDHLPAPWVYCWSAALAASTDMVRSVGAFDIGLPGVGSEDIDLGYRLQLKGASFTLSNVAVFHWPHRRKRDQQERNDRLHELRMLRKHPRIDMEMLAAFGPENANNALEQFSTALPIMLDHYRSEAQGTGLTDGLRGSDVVVGFSREHVPDEVKCAVFPTSDNTIGDLPLYGVRLPFENRERGVVTLGGIWECLPEPLSARVLQECSRIGRRVYVLKSTHSGRAKPQIEWTDVRCYWERTQRISRWWYDFPLKKVARFESYYKYEVTTNASVN